jgi:MFS superfamily sulfate permease-like transporter
VSLAAVLILGMLQGLILGVVISVGAFLVQSSRPSSPVRVVRSTCRSRPALDIESVNVPGSLRHELAGQGIDLWLAGVHAEVAGMLDRSGLADEIGRDRLYRDVEGAVADGSA